MRPLASGVAPGQTAAAWGRCRTCAPCIQRSVARRVRPSKRGLPISCVAAPAQQPSGPAKGAKKVQWKKVDQEDFMEKGMRELPRPGDVQQTLVQSFTLGGMGLHTGEYAYVRVRPAFAGEGRYFVRVPQGTNSHLFQLRDDTRVIPEEELDEPQQEDVEEERIKVQLFQQWLAAQEDDGYEGDFMTWLRELDSEPLSEAEKRALRNAVEEVARAEGAEGAEEADLFADEDDLVPEEVVAADPSKEAIIPAHIDNAIAEEGFPFFALVGAEDNVVANPALLLSALEACGVDNARIEIEGGSEVPVLDNTALGWTLAIQQAGLRTAPFAPGDGGGGEAEGAEAAAAAEAGEGGERLPDRFALMPGEPFTVQEGEAFVSFYPGDFTKVTAGIDVQDVAPIIGQQWYSWRFGQDYHYRYELAPSRGWVESVDALFELRGQGFAKAAGESMFIIGHGTRWWDPQMVKYHNDEPSRHELLQLIGALALAGGGGNSGVPVGHIVAFNAGPKLLLSFVEKLIETCQRLGDVAVDAHDLALWQMQLLEQQAEGRDVASKARKRRGEMLSEMGGAADIPQGYPVFAGEDDEGEEADGGEEGAGAGGGEGEGSGGGGGGAAGA